MKKATLALRRKTPCRKSLERARPVELPNRPGGPTSAWGEAPRPDLKHPALMVRGPVGLLSEHRQRTGHCKNVGGRNTNITA
jgi:hypothetical protein